MRLPEQRLWDGMRNALRDSFYLERIENVVMPGRPDVDVMHRGVIIPVELKVRVRPPTRCTALALGKSGGLNPNQLNWWLQWNKRGGSGFILAKVGATLSAIPATMSELVNEMTYADLAQYEVDWHDLKDLIRREVSNIKTRS